MTDKPKPPGDAFARHEPMPQPLGDDEFYPEWVVPVANDNAPDPDGTKYARKRVAPNAEMEPNYPNG